MESIIKKNKPIAYTLGVIALFSVSYMVYKLIKGKKQLGFAEGGFEQNIKSDNTDNIGVDVVKGGSKLISNDSYPLKKGMQGLKIYVMQSAMKHLGSSINPSGRFDSDTYDALQDDGYFTYFGLNWACSLGGCYMTYNEINDRIFKPAKDKGWDINKAWTEAKKLYS